MAVPRSLYLRIARRLDKRKSKEVDVKQPTLVEVLSCSRDQVQENEAEVEGEGEGEVEDEGKVEEGVDDATGYMEAPISATSEVSSGTRRFEVEHPIFYRFEQYLMSVDGGEKSQNYN